MAELDRVLAEMPQKTAHKIIRRSLVQAGKLVQQAMIDFAPRASGWLKDRINMKVKLKKNNQEGKAYIGPAGRQYYPVSRGSLAIGVSTGKRAKSGGAVPVVSVARFLEFGTSKMAARPFMRPSFAASVQKALGLITESIRSAIAELRK